MLYTQLSAQFPTTGLIAYYPFSGNAKTSAITETTEPLMQSQPLQEELYNAQGEKILTKETRESKKEITLDLTDCKTECII